MPGAKAWNHDVPAQEWFQGLSVFPDIRFLHWNSWFFQTEDKFLNGFLHTYAVHISLKHRHTSYRSSCQIIDLSPHKQKTKQEQYNNIQNTFLFICLNSSIGSGIINYFLFFHRPLLLLCFATQLITGNLPEFLPLLPVNYSTAALLFFALIHCPVSLFV